jgi:hypothetical protein
MFKLLVTLLAAAATVTALPQREVSGTPSVVIPDATTAPAGFNM